MVIHHNKKMKALSCNKKFCIVTTAVCYYRCMTFRHIRVFRPVNNANVIIAAAQSTSTCRHVRQCMKQLELL